MSLTADLLPVHDVAKMLNVDRSRVGVLLRQGRFAGAVKIGRDWVVPRESVENFRRLPPPGRKSKTKQQQAEDRAVVAAALEELKGGMRNEHPGEDSGAE